MILATMILSFVGVLIAGQTVIGQEIGADMILQFFYSLYSNLVITMVC